MSSWRGVLDLTLCDNVYQWLVAGRWFSLGTSVSPSNKTDRHELTVILLKVALNTLTLTLVKYCSNFKADSPPPGICNLLIFLLPYILKSFVFEIFWLWAILSEYFIDMYVQNGMFLLANKNKKFQYYYRMFYMTLSVHDEDYYRNASCVLNEISTYLLTV